AGVGVSCAPEPPAPPPGRAGGGPPRLVDPKRHPFAALATAFLDDGAALLVPRGAGLGQPVHVVFASSGAQPDRVQHPRVLVVAEPRSRVQVIVDHVALQPARGFTDAAVDGAGGEG